MRLILALFLFLITLSSRAEMVIEPYAGISLSKTTYRGDDDSGSLILYGTRLGWAVIPETLHLGLDYEIANSSDVERRHLSAYSALTFPILWKIFVKYGLSSNMQLDEVDDSIEYINGTAFGFGYTGLPYVDLNFEIENSDYESDGRSIKWVAFVFTASAPFEF